MVTQVLQVIFFNSLIERMYNPYCDTQLAEISCSTMIKEEEENGFPC